MEYSEEDLREHETKAVFLDPPLEYLERSVPCWRHYKKDPKSWMEICQVYTFVLDQNDPSAFRHCPYCNVICDSHKFFMLHINSYRHACRRAEVKGLPRPTHPLFCKYCDFQARSKRALIGHKQSYIHCCKVAVARGERLPTNETFCKICNREFSTKQALITHISSQRHKLKETNALFTCAVCGGCTFSTKQALDFHKISKKHQINVGTLKKKVLPTYCQCCAFQASNRKKYIMHCKRKTHIKKVNASVESPQKMRVKVV